ncbi:unnamed protein product [Oikopleura dioica]|uniref:Uncharacterized protein n=1 Tax=Oikopleura dioica TaxID=34765 RepID=E4XUQ0_OIKDI|nr:unnamed protein product [Oikopleura dioica]
MSMERALFKNASFAFETSAMSFDEIENKLYWVKNGETVFSSNANGEEVTSHVTIEGAQISCLVSKGDFIFAADELLDEESREYKIHVISKKNEQTAVNYRVDKKLTCVGLFTRF